MEKVTHIRESKRKQLIGTVVSTKNTKTISVAIEIYKKHPLYGKRYKVTRKLSVHDENESANEGDVVKIAETRPISKTKKFRLVEVVKTAKEGN